MGRLLLMWCLLLSSCEVSRDLRPERFACDAGGLCGGANGQDAGAGDSGIRPINCPIGGSCRCREGDSCLVRCSGSCSVECLEGSTCEVECGFSQCQTRCAPGADCTVSCATGACDTICEATSSCEIECALAQCTCSGPECPF